MEFRLPKLGMSVVEAMSSSGWYRGRRRSEGQPIVTVELDKAETELPSPVAGRVRRSGGAEPARRSTWVSSWRSFELPTPDDRSGTCDIAPRAAQVKRNARAQMARRMDEAWKAPVFHLTVRPTPTRGTRCADGLDGVTSPTCCCCAAPRRCAASEGQRHYDARGRSPSSVRRVTSARRRHAAGPARAGAARRRVADAEEIASQRRALVDRARAGELSIAEMQGGTFTSRTSGCSRSSNLTRSSTCRR